MTKIARHFTIDLDVYEAARRAGINLSEAAESGLYASLGKNKKGGRDSPYSLRMQRLLAVAFKSDLGKCAEAASKNPLKAYFWSKMFRRKYGITVTPAEIMEVFGHGEVPGKIQKGKGHG
jgi:hypothetical protein